MPTHARREAIQKTQPDRKKGLRYSKALLRDRFIMKRPNFGLVIDCQDYTSTGKWADQINACNGIDFPEIQL